MEKIIGKTIKSINKVKCSKKYDDICLDIEFTDGYKVRIEGFFGGYTRHSEDEYPTDVNVRKIK